MIYIGTNNQQKWFILSIKMNINFGVHSQITCKAGPFTLQDIQKIEI